MNRSSHILQRLRRAAVCNRGIAAVEFALIVPLLLLLSVGATQLGAAVVIKTKVRTAASTTSQIASQYQTITNSDMTLILGAGSVLLSPYSTTPLKVTLSHLTIDGSGNAVVNWSDSFQGSPRTVGSKVTIPAALATSGSVYLLAESSYGFVPAIATAYLGTINIAETVYLTPRSGSAVSRTP